MPQKTKIEVSTFNKGLITEAGPLTFPDNASLVDENFVLLKDGSRKRRLGMDYEDDYEEGFAGGMSDDSILDVFIWENPTQTGTFDIVVVQVHDFLYFFNSKGSPISDSPLYVDGFGNGQPIPIPSLADGVRLSVASIRGQFVIAFGSASFLVLTYDQENDIVLYDSKRIEVRDLWGVESIYSLDERPAITPTTLTGSQVVDLTADQVQHLYNLRNQGWPATQRTSTSIDGSSYHREYDTPLLPAIDVDAITDVNFLASDSDVVWRAKTTSSDHVETIGLYSPFEIYKNFYGGTPANKGKAIIDLFDRDNSRQDFYDAIAETSEMIIEGDTIVSDSATGSVSQVASYAGRLFFSISDETIINKDTRSPKLANLIFFSQVITNDQEMGKCYQKTDPTSEFEYGILDTDGGFVSIPEAGRILKLAPLGNSLFVLTTTGVWEIHGGEQVFSATNQNLTKTSNIGALSSSSVVVSDSIITYFTNGGIYAISIDQTSLRGVASNITAASIATYYLNIPNDQKALSTGIFDEINRKLRWLFRDEDIPFPSVYNRELVFDIDLQAFYVNTFEVDTSVPGSSQVGIRGFFNIPEVKYWIVRDSGASSISYSFGDFKNTSFKDFDLYDAPAVLLTGYLTGNTASSAKQIKNIIAHFVRTESGFIEGEGGLEFVNPSSCLVTAQWEWTNSATGGRWNTPFEAYRLTVPYYPEDEDDPFDYGYTVITSKTGIRGKGRALSLKFESQEEKNLHILGWGLEVKVDDQFS
jgi:hypothetical protein